MNELKAKCAQILLDGDLHINEETGNITVDISDDDKNVLIEYAVNTILYEALKEMLNKEV